MARAVIGGRTYVIAPFKLRELRRAAPHIDRAAARAREGGPGGVGVMAEAAFDMVSVLAAGLDDVDPEALAAEVGLDELAALRSTFEAVLAEAGLTPAAGGEANGLGESTGAGVGTS